MSRNRPSKATLQNVGQVGRTDAFNLTEEYIILPLSRLAMNHLPFRASNGCESGRNAHWWVLLLLNGKTLEVEYRYHRFIISIKKKHGPWQSSLNWLAAFLHYWIEVQLQGMRPREKVREKVYLAIPFGRYFLLSLASGSLFLNVTYFVYSDNKVAVPKGPIKRSVLFLPFILRTRETRIIRKDASSRNAKSVEGQVYACSFTMTVRRRWGAELGGLIRKRRESAAGKASITDRYPSQVIAHW